MKKLGILLSALIVLVAFQAQAQSGPVLTFKEKSIDFGDIVQ